jgi:hypothetical protein
MTMTATKIFRFDMTPELKSFLTDLVSVLEKHDAEIIAADSLNVFLGGVFQQSLDYLTPSDIKREL